MKNKNDAKCNGLSIKVKAEVKVSHNLIAVRAVGIRVSLYLGHNK